MRDIQYALSKVGERNMIIKVAGVDLNTRVCLSAIEAARRSNAPNKTVAKQVEAMMFDAIAKQLRNDVVNLTQAEVSTIIEHVKRETGYN